MTSKEIICAFTKKENAYAAVEKQYNEWKNEGWRDCDYLAPATARVYDPKSARVEGHSYEIVLGVKKTELK